MKLLTSKFNEKNFFLRSQLDARAYVRIWTLPPWLEPGLNRLTCSARALIKLICIRECFDSALTGFDPGGELLNMGYIGMCGPKG